MCASEQSLPRLEGKVPMRKGSKCVVATVENPTFHHDLILDDAHEREMDLLKLFIVVKLSSIHHA
jgi:hypothetical protein